MSAQGRFHSDITGSINPLNLRDMGSILQHSWLINLNIDKLLFQQNQCMAVILDSHSFLMEEDSMSLTCKTPVCNI